MKFVLVALLVISIMALGLSQNANAQFQGGGVNKDGSWYVGEGLKAGDFYSYGLCHVYYKDCTPFQIDFWVEGSQKVGSEDQWKLQTVVKDGKKIIKGTINVGKIAAEPIGSTPNLVPYAAAFKSSLSWLSAYATADTENLTGKGPKKFSAPSWGRIGNIGGEQIIPTSAEEVAVPDGIYDTVLVSWKTGGKVNRVWIVDEFPFPVKADTYAHVSQGVPPQEYRFDLLDYQKNIKTNPFTNIKSSADLEKGLNCPTNTDEFVTVTKNTNTNTMTINLKYSPPNPKQGCTMDMIIDFKNKYNQEDFENEVHYDILVVESTPDGLQPTRSIAEEEKRNALFITAGQVRRSIDVKESGTTTYAIYVSGTGPETAPIENKAGFITFDVNVQKGTTTTIQCEANQDLVNGKCVTKTTKPSDVVTIPSWIKNNAKFWADGQITDKDFVSGIQYLITNGIIKLKS